VACVFCSSTTTVDAAELTLPLALMPSARANAIATLPSLRLMNAKRPALSVVATCPSAITLTPAGDVPARLPTICTSPLRKRVPEGVPVSEFSLP